MASNPPAIYSTIADKRKYLVIILGNPPQLGCDTTWGLLTHICVIQQGHHWTYFQLDPQEHTSLKFEPKCNYFRARKIVCIFVCKITAILFRFQCVYLETSTNYQPLFVESAQLRTWYVMPNLLPNCQWATRKQPLAQIIISWENIIS